MMDFMAAFLPQQCFVYCQIQTIREQGHRSLAECVIPCLLGAEAKSKGEPCDKQYFVNCDYEKADCAHDDDGI